MASNVKRITDKFISEHKQECCGCHACFNVCPTKAIRMEADSEGFLYPQIDEKKCIKCGRCARVCQILNRKSNSNKDLQVYACINQNLNERMNSSSGGVFICLAKAILQRGGYVFGAAFDDEMNVHHDMASDLDGCRKFMGSKYVQSSIGRTYKQVKEILEKGGVVLFTGTPCQIHGLKLFLGADKIYEGLITADIICHGVPSPLIFKKYIKEFAVKNKAKIQEIKFRDKAFGWRRYSMSFSLKSGEKVLQRIDQSKYLRGFLSDLYLRPSCYHCFNKGDSYFSDLTLGDYWGVENKNPELDDDKGTSIILVRTPKGRKLVESILSQVKLEQIDYESIIEGNPCLKHAVMKNPKRKSFFLDLKQKDDSVDVVISRYLPKIQAYQRCKMQLKIIFIRMGIWPLAKKIKDIIFLRL